jgi:hypothetical protein
VIILAPIGLGISRQSTALAAMPATGDFIPSLN